MPVEQVLGPKHRAAVEVHQRHIGVRLDFETPFAGYGEALRDIVGGNTGNSGKRHVTSIMPLSQ